MPTPDRAADAARWLLMTHDRVASERFPLPMSFSAKSSACAGRGVSEVASKLRKVGLIRYERGTVEVLDRAGLELIACEYYGPIQRQFESLLGAPQKQGTRSRSA